MAKKAFPKEIMLVWNGREGEEFLDPHTSADSVAATMQRTGKEHVGVYVLKRVATVTVTATTTVK